MPFGGRKTRAEPTRPASAPCNPDGTLSCSTHLHRLSPAQALWKGGRQPPHRGGNPLRSGAAFPGRSEFSSPPRNSGFPVRELLRNRSGARRGFPAPACSRPGSIGSPGAPGRVRTASLLQIGRAAGPDPADGPGGFRGKKVGQGKHHPEPPPRVCLQPPRLRPLPGPPDLSPGSGPDPFRRCRQPARICSGAVSTGR